MRHGSLFSGIGGFDLAAEWMGWENIFHCEINRFCQKILKHYWPDATSYTDITKTDFSIHRGQIDIITGGFPCQPFSAAGKRKGNQDDRHLWPEMLRAIREIQPVWVVGENVPGLLNWKRGMVLHEIKTDLEGEGFEVFPPCILPACGLNAPHKRERLWIIAHLSGSSYRCSQDSSDKKIQGEFGGVYSKVYASDTISTGFETERKLTKSAAQNPRISYLRSRWNRFPTQSPVCGRNDGIPNRVDRIKALGNAIVPQVAYEIFKAIEQTNET